MSHLNTIIDQVTSRLKQQHIDQYEVVLSDSKGISATVRDKSTESISQHIERSLGISIYQGGKTGFVSGADLSPASIDSLINAAIDIAKNTEPDPFIGLAPKERMAWQTPDLGLYHSQMPSVSLITDCLNTCESVALNTPNIKNSEGAQYQGTQSQVYYANSHDLLLYSEFSRHHISCSVIANDNQKNTLSYSAYDYCQSIDLDCLNQATIVGEKAAAEAVSKLGSQSLVTQTLPIIFSPKVSSSLFSYLLNGLSGSNQYKQTSFLLNAINQQVLPDWLDLIEIPQQFGKIGTQFADSDGVLKHEQYFIKSGVVTNYVMGQYSANQLGRKTTACAGGVSHCYININIDKPLEGLMAEMQTGLVITELMGQGVNLTTGNYSKGASGFYVKNGQYQYPVSGITIAGNLLEMLKNIVYIGNDFDDRHKIKVGSVLLESMTVSGQ